MHHIVPSAGDAPRIRRWGREAVARIEGFVIGE